MLVMMHLSHMCKLMHLINETHNYGNSYGMCSSIP